MKKEITDSKGNQLDKVHLYSKLIELHLKEQREIATGGLYDGLFDTDLMGRYKRIYGALSSLENKQVNNLLTNIDPDKVSEENLEKLEDILTSYVCHPEDFYGLE